MTKVTTESAGNTCVVAARSTQRSSRKGVVRILIVALIGWCVFAWVAARFLIVTVALPKADAIIVLSGSSSYVERTRLAAQLWSTGRAPEIVLTNDGERGGWSTAEQRNPFFSERAVSELQKAGVLSSDIVVLPEAVAGTHDEAIQLRRYVADRKLQSIIVVTSAYHSRRALWTMHKVFEGSGVKIGLETPLPGEQTPSPGIWWVKPFGWKVVAGEYVKLIYYYYYYR